MLANKFSTRFLRYIGPGILGGTLVSAVPQTLFAQAPPNNGQCVQDLYGKNLQCTANDVKIAFAYNVVDPVTGITIPSCTAGSRFDFVATFKVVTTATARENIGMYFATDGQTNAKTGGSCADNIISPLHRNPLYANATTYPDAPQLGEPLAVRNSAGVVTSIGYEELDTSTPTDTCGDISTDDNNQLIKVYVSQALCQAGANGNVALPNCTSWQQPGGTNLCVSQGTAYPYPPPPAALPGSPAKCNCDDTFTIPVTVQNAMLTVAKTCLVGNMTTPDKISCAFDGGTNGTQVEGGQVTYGLTIGNTSNIGSVIVDQVCDSYYGPLYTAIGYTPPANQCGTAKTLTSNSCGTMGTPWTIGTTAATCSFQAYVGENANIPDIITVYAHGASSGTAITPAPYSNSIGVTSGDNPSAVTIGAGVTSPSANTTSFCADTTYNVSATNSGTDDGTIMLTGLSEQTLGPLAAPANGTTITSTNCNASSTSPASLVFNGTPYTCNFRTHFCDSVKDVIATPGTCTAGKCSTGKDNTTSCSVSSDCDLHCTGIQQSVAISGSAYGDEGVNDTTNITITPGTKTVTACVTQTFF